MSSCVADGLGQQARGLDVRDAVRERVRRHGRQLGQRLRQRGLEMGEQPARRGLARVERQPGQTRCADSTRLDAPRSSSRRPRCRAPTRRRTAPRAARSGSPGGGAGAADGARRTTAADLFRITLNARLFRADFASVHSLLPDNHRGSHLDHRQPTPSSIRRDPSILNWTETMFMIFSVPEAGILGNLYVLARPNLGVATSAVMVQQGFCRQPYEIDFSDPQVHLPCPQSFKQLRAPQRAQPRGHQAAARLPRRVRVVVGRLPLRPRLRGRHAAVRHARPGREPARTSSGDDWAEPHKAGAVVGQGPLRRARPRHRRVRAARAPLRGRLRRRHGPQLGPALGGERRNRLARRVVDPRLVRRGLRDAPRDVARHPRRRGRLRQACGSAT